MVNVKGGSGKTTTAMYLAAAIAQRNAPVVVVDACPSGSSYRWAKVAEAAGTPMGFTVTSEANQHLGLAVAELAQNHHVVIDSAPANERIGRATVQVGTFVLIPLNARPNDVRQSVPIYKEARQLNKPAYGLLVRTRHSDSSNATTRLLASEDRMPLLNTEVPELNRIGWRFEDRIEDVRPYDQVLIEIQEKGAP